MADVKSEMSGTVFELPVEEGDEVSEGEAVVILEAMKMEVDVESPVDGTVSEIKVDEDDFVEEEEVVAEVEEG
jgi:acetyl-CoA carboxylase biotin carboxyl carrier protein